jgi:hypothetical protein
MARHDRYAIERPSPLAVFVARAEARALLWEEGELDLHDAVDELQAAAVRCNQTWFHLGQRGTMVHIEERC